jgi:hypothetical protein
MFTPRPKDESRHETRPFTPRSVAAVVPTGGPSRPPRSGRGGGVSRDERLRREEVRRTSEREVTSETPKRETRSEEEVRPDVTDTKIKPELTDATKIKDRGYRPPRFGPTLRATQVQSSEADLSRPYRIWQDIKEVFFRLEAINEKSHLFCTRCAIGCVTLIITNPLRLRDAKMNCLHNTQQAQELLERYGKVEIFLPTSEKYKCGSYEITRETLEAAKSHMGEETFPVEKETE